MGDGMLDRTTLERAFEELGKELARRRIRAEIAVYGGSAIILQFDFRESTRDTDVRILAGHGAVVEAQAEVAERLGLPRGWLNEQVSVYTSTARDAEARLPFGVYPGYGQPWLTVFVARPEYLLAMKLMAARSGTADFDDAVALAADTGKTSEDDLRGLLEDYYPRERIDPKTEAAIVDVAAEAAAKPRAGGGP